MKIRLNFLSFEKEFREIRETVSSLLFFYLDAYHMQTYDVQTYDS